MPPPPDEGRVAYVFGYGSLVELTEPLALGGRLHPAAPGRLRGFRRRWGVVMRNWEAGEDEKHFVDPASGLKPRLAVAYLDLVEAAGGSVNGLAIPVDAARLAALDRREVNYRRVEVSDRFEPGIAATVFVYLGTEPARARVADGTEVCVSRQYVERVRRAFAALGGDALAEYERGTEPLPFPERELEPRYPRPAAGPG